MATDPITHNGSPISGAVASASTTATAALAAAPPSASFTYAVNRQRIPVTVDPFTSTLPAGASVAIQNLRTAGTQKVYLGIKQIQSQLPQIHTILQAPSVPSPLMGQLLEPNGNPASTVQIEFDPATGQHPGPRRYCDHRR